MVRKIPAAISATAALAGSADAAPITADHTDLAGRTWANLNDTTGFTWNQIDSICANDGVTACSGTIGTADFTR